MDGACPVGTLHQPFFLFYERCMYYEYNYDDYYYYMVFHKKGLFFVFFIIHSNDEQFA